MTEAYYLGVDGGGSKTLAVLVNERGEEVGRGLAPGANYNTVGLSAALEHISIAVEQAIRAAGCRLPVCKAWLGLAGIDRQADHDLLLPQLRGLAEWVRLTNDAELLLAGLEQAVGVVLISGTGSIALGRDAAGRRARSGGWGHILGDEGSGYAIAQQALQAVVRASDGRGPQTALRERILQAWNLRDTDELIGEVYGEPEKAKIASLSSCVMITARSGDQVAAAILQQAARELALAVHAVCQALGFAQRDIPLALGGGLLINEADFCTQVIQQIRHSQPIGEVVLVSHPTVTAARAAMQIA
ncbi:MAG TPA: BadF/BadG/BcrA/BcrD ATPase family protein [Ktedonobacteraceae bacterium]|jgi:N-acetylglucosamine kinase-like BadF-type ATPase